MFCIVDRLVFMVKNRVKYRVVKPPDLARRILVFILNHYRKKSQEKHKREVLHYLMNEATNKKCCFHWYIYINPREICIKKPQLPLIHFRIGIPMQEFNHLGKLFFC